MVISKEEAIHLAGTGEVCAPPCPPLPNCRQEAFARRIAAGLSATAAYASASGRPRDASSRVNGRRLLTKAYIRDRIAEIESAAALDALPEIGAVIGEAALRASATIREGSFREACKATEEFAGLVIRLDEALSRKDR